MLRGIVRLAAIVVVPVLLAGCGAVASSGTTSSPSDEEKTSTDSSLATAARSVYARYLDAVEAVSERGNSDFRELRPLLTDRAYEEELGAFRELAARGIRTSGASRLVKFEPQRVNESAGRVLAYACVDLSQVRVLDRAGKDVTPSGRPNRQTSLVTFALRDETLLLDKNGSWSGDSIC